MPEQFHFLQPLWFLALPPMALLLGWLARTGRDHSDWRHACESHLLPFLLNQPVRAFQRLPVWLSALAGLLAVVALADPVWQKQPQPVYRNQDAVVVVLDLSRSMLSADLTPSRLERARYKVEEILKRRQDGQTGLVVFAGDAFAVSPLTNDARTIRALLAPLNPGLMPVQGSRADLGLRQAGHLLQQAGIARGDVLLITDGYSDPRTVDVAADLRRQGYRLSVLGVGGDRPAPIPDGQGGFVRDSQGRVVLPALESAPLQQLAAAGGGRYSGITADDADLAQVLPSSRQALGFSAQSTELATDRWQSHGPWLVLALLPLAALAFRRGWLLTIPLAIVLSLGSLPRPAMAAGWDDLWQRRDQQAHQALRSGDYARARQLAGQPLQRGEAAYREGDYAGALEAYKASATAQGDYNRGNALAQLGRYQDAITSYEQALAKQPGMADALHNKQVLEKWLQQQQADNKNDKHSQDKDQDQDKDKNGKNGKGKDDRQQADQRNSGDGQDKHKDKDDNKDGRQQADANHGGVRNEKSESQQADKRHNGNEPDQGSRDRNNRQPAQAEAASANQKGDEQPAGSQDADAQDQKGKPADAAAPLDAAGKEQQQADERWLRRIPDDPGGLLRRKFLYQYSQRGTPPETAQQSW
jgi:Ca-activated chloride channel family protein